MQAENVSRFKTATVYRERKEGYCMDCKRWDSHLIDGVVCKSCHDRGCCSGSVKDGE